MTNGRKFSPMKQPSAQHSANSTQLQDKILTCSDCKELFAFTVSEQRFFQEKGFEHEPKRCSGCRARKRRRFANRDDGRHDR